MCAAQSGNEMSEEHLDHASVEDGVLNIRELERKYFGDESKPWWGIFRNYTAYFDKYSTIGYMRTFSFLLLLFLLQYTFI